MAATAVAVGAAYARSVFTAGGEPPPLDLSLRVLPMYGALSLARGFIALTLSLAFALAYATTAAHHPRAGRVMMPVIDVLQSVPVLGFLPGFVLGALAVVPARSLALELACVMMIFTGQVWNLVFGYHAALRDVPPALREVAAGCGLSRWRTFAVLELPAGATSLIWNGMLSMAGGWFFLSVAEAFTLGNRDYHVAGIGSYAAAAVRTGDARATAGALLAMAVIIVAVDQFVWQPLATWGRRFTPDETATAGDRRPSWVLALLRESWSARRVCDAIAAATAATAATARRRGAGPAARRPPAREFPPHRLAGLVLTIATCAAAAAAAGPAARLLAAVPLYDPAAGRDYAHVALAILASFGRTSAAVLAAALWAVPAGVVIGLSPRLSRWLRPAAQAAASFPAPMLFPAVAALLVRSPVPFSVACTALMILAAQWYVLFNAVAGASAISSDLNEVARAARLGRRRTWQLLYLPAVCPSVVTGLITAAGGAWNATIVAEYVQLGNATYRAPGVGSTISDAAARGDYPLLAAAVAVMAGFVVATNQLFWSPLARAASRRYGGGGDDDGAERRPA